MPRDVDSRDSGTAYRGAVRALGRAQRFGMHPSLAGIRALSSVMEEPHRSFRSVQVTGTNGKTSVVRMLAALLEAHGETTGMYTSPHLLEYVERIELSGSAVPRALFADAVAAALDAADRIASAQLDALGLAEDAPAAAEPAFTEFELLTAAALWLFREHGVTTGVLEVGMGGRWDATSIVEPAVAVVTGVALDHTRHLGETIEAIAEDKAHIIKPGSVAVLGPATQAVDDVFARRAAGVAAPVVRVLPESPTEADPAVGGVVTYSVVGRPDSPGGTTRVRVHGRFGVYAAGLPAPAYQAPNAAVAIAAAEAVLGRALDSDAVRCALGTMGFPGRFQVLRKEPCLVADGAHNPDAALALAGALADAFGADERITIVLAVLDDKDATGIVEALAARARRFVATTSRSDRALSASELARRIRAVSGVEPEIADSVGEALERMSDEEDVLVTGSLTTAADAIEWASGEEAGWR